jgi:hypothetical protein
LTKTVRGIENTRYSAKKIKIQQPQLLKKFGNSNVHIYTLYYLFELPHPPTPLLGGQSNEKTMNVVKHTCIIYR